MDKKDIKSTLKRYYTLAHAMTPRKNSPTHGRSAESGDETDRSVDNDITESFFMDEINANTESCSLDSSRENLLDGDFTKESKSGSRPNSRPSSARRNPSKDSELSSDQRIKILEEGLKEADMEREVVLSCLGKEYLERITMQNYLQEICSKSGYSYEEVVSSMFTETGAKKILENIMESRAKGQLDVKESRLEKVVKPQPSVVNRSSRNNLCKDEGSGDILIGKEKDKSNEYAKQRQLKEFFTRFTGAEITTVNSGMKKAHDQSSHTQYTKDLHELKEDTLDDSACTKNLSGDVSKRDMKEDKEHIVVANQSSKDNSKYPWEPSKIISSGIHTASFNQNNGINVERPVLKTMQNHDVMTFHGNDTTEKLNMPGKTGRNNMDQSSVSILRGIDLKGLDVPEKSIDSIDEGIFMIKSFLNGLQSRKQNFDAAADNPILRAQVKNGYDSSYDSDRPKRKFSLDESGSERAQLDYKPQRRRSYAEGMNMNKWVENDSKMTAKSRLLKPTVASRNKIKEKRPRREFDSDTESARHSKELRATPLRRSNSDVRHGSKRHTYGSYTSAEDDSSVDGEERDYSPDRNAFRYAYQVHPEINDREYTKLMSILNMLHEQKMKWDSESRDLNEKLDIERKLRLDLSHDNGVLRKSLEAANRAIKEINSNVQELKLTIVPLREENSKLRDQNQSFKTKLSLQRNNKEKLSQELQELKQIKKRYEEKLCILGELYKNDRIKLAIDNNNNNESIRTASSSSIELPKGGLSELLQLEGNLPGGGSSPVSKNYGRSRDFSKRHSFHGFEKIEELAGDAEELLAEKEKLEQENQSLKDEVKKLRENIGANAEGEYGKEDDLLKSRKGWRMQREESKQRIIRDILNTESNQIYGRPYASCTNLTLQNEKKDDSNAVNHVEIGSESVDGPDKGAKRAVPSGKFGDAPLEQSAERNKATGGTVSWKEESEKIKKRLENCKFEKLLTKDKISPKKEDKVNSQESAKVGKEKAIWDVGSSDIFEEKVVDGMTGSPSGKAGKSSNLQTGNDNRRGQENGLKDLSKSISTNQMKSEINDQIVEKKGKRKEMDSLASPQWPIVREKIQAIYEQPVAILEQSLYERSTVGMYKDTMEEKKNIGGYVTTSDTRKLQQSVNSTVFDRNDVKSDMKVSGKRDSERGFEAVSQKQKGNTGQGMGASKEGYGRSGGNWQRKSTSEDMTSYEDYRRKLRREELEIVYLKSNATEDVEQHFEKNLTSSNGTLFDNGMVMENNTEEKRSNEAYNIKQSKRRDLENNNIDHKSVEISDQAQWGERDESPWVKVPVYLRNTTRPSYHQMSTPIGNVQEHFEVDRVIRKGTGLKARGEKETRNGISYSGSAISNTGVSEEERELGKGSRSVKRNFVRQSSGTVLYLDEIADSDSGSSSEASTKVLRRKNKSFRRPRPKSEIISSHLDSSDERISGDFKRNRSLRLPKKTKDDFYSVDIFFDGESQDDSAIQMHSQFFDSSENAIDQQQLSCQHQLLHKVAKHQHDAYRKQRAHSESGPNVMRQSQRRPKSPGRFSCEMCREMSKRKSSQERYCWEKYFPIGETTIETRVIKEDYV